MWLLSWWMTVHQIAKTLFRRKCLMNLAHLARVVRSSYPIDWDAAYTVHQRKRVFMVAADCETGAWSSLISTTRKDNWMRLVLASCTLPFVTRGRIQVGGRWVFDGGYADAIPLNRIPRRRQQTHRRGENTSINASMSSKIHFDWLASYWFRDNEAMAKFFESYCARSL